MEFNWESGQFERAIPTPSPTATVKVTVLNDIHAKYGFISRGKCQADVTAVTDTGCQTTTAGLDICQALGIKVARNILVPTRHKVVGITNTPLDGVGAIFAKIEINSKVTKQMIHISRNSSGLFLSEIALKDLGILHPDFPAPFPSRALANSAKPVDDEDCKCIPRTEPPTRPETIPYPPTLENRPKLKEWLVSSFKSSAFNTCTHQPLKCMTGKPMKIEFKEDSEPHKVHTPIEVPHHWKKKVKANLDRDVRLGIIEPVPQGTPTTWCSRMVVASKKSGEPRRTVDLQKLNDATLRETHHTTTPFNIVSVIPRNTYRTTLDAWNGYHSLAIEDKAKNSTKFITEWGRYRYCRAPQGFHGSGDAYTRRFDDITADSKRVSRCIDDSLLWDHEIEGAFWHTFDYLQHCAENGIVFNVEKFIFAQETCEYAGFELTPDGYRPPKKVLESISNFPTPKSTTDVRSWFGLINQVAYTFSQSSVMAPFRDLLSKKKHPKFYWDEELERTFKKSKEVIVDMIKDGVCLFEMERTTCLSTDWSKVGLGYTLSQKHCNCKADPQTKTYTPNCGKGHWKLVLAGSRVTTQAESRYAPIEGEALGVAYGLQQCRIFVIGCPDLIVAVDHKPLTRILNERPLESIENPRLLRIKEKTLMYKFKIIHVPGKSNMAPDAASRYPSSSISALSRYPANPITTEDMKDNDDLETETVAKAFAIRQGNQLPSAITWEEVNHESIFDDETCQLVAMIQHGFPNDRLELPESLRKYHQIREDLYVIGNSVFRDKKMLIPRKLRGAIIDGLHASHQGVSSMKAYARERFFWPGLDADIKQKREQCRSCIENAPSQANEPMILTPPPEMPFQQVAADFYQVRARNYLIYADRYSGWTEVALVPNTSFVALKRKMITWFRTYGVPEEISTDGGPPFQSTEYAQFLNQWKITSRLSSAYYPQSNGRAEVAVKSMKRVLQDNTDPRSGDLSDAAARAILTHRNIPSQDTGCSPSEMLFGYKIRDHLPNKFRMVRREWRNILDAKKNAAAVKNRNLDNRQIKRRELCSLEAGDSVAIQNNMARNQGSGTT